MKMKKKMKKKILKYITSHIIDLTQWECGALQIWKDSKGNKLVDIEWADGVSAFTFSKVMKLIKEKGSVTKSEIIEYCL